ncbi:MAG: molybdate ABC transporter substrate-binding protein [Bryobacteraceae bacterium]
MSIIRIIALFAGLLPLFSCAPNRAPLRIAAAADLRYALEEVIRVFRAQHGNIAIEPVYGSSGNFYSELLNRAPFDLFLSADVSYPRKLAEKGMVMPGSEFTYAVGRIVLWTDRGSGIDVKGLHLEALRANAVRHVAIANPAHAPYGRAAVAALQSTSLYDGVRDKLVMGENISQAFQLVQGGAAEVGIVALSLAMGPGMEAKGIYWELPPGSYPRITQGGAIPKWARQADTAKEFSTFLVSSEGCAILKRYGFSGE